MDTVLLVKGQPAFTTHSDIPLDEHMNTLGCERAFLYNGKWLMHDAIPEGVVEQAKRAGTLRASIVYDNQNYTMLNVYSNKHRFIASQNGIEFECNGKNCAQNGLRCKGCPASFAQSDPLGGAGPQIRDLLKRLNIMRGQLEDEELENLLKKVDAMKKELDETVEAEKPRDHAALLNLLVGTALDTSKETQYLTAIAVEKMRKTVETEDYLHEKHKVLTDPKEIDEAKRTFNQMLLKAAYGRRRR